jgi:hypothetical protein
MKTPSNALDLYSVIVGDILIKNSRRLNSDAPDDWLPEHFQSRKKASSGGAGLVLSGSARTFSCRAAEVAVA